MTSLPYQVVDAFTKSPFSGNQAAVVLFAAADARSTSAAYQLSLAREFNFSETAFLTPLPTSTPAAPHYGLRWWTPVAEFPLCGHATLASAHVLFGTRHGDAELLRFETMSGTLTARKRNDGGLELDFPADPTVLESKLEGAEARLMRAIGTLGIEGIAGNVRGWARGKLAWIVELDKSVPLASLGLDVKDFVGRAFCLRGRRAEIRNRRNSLVGTSSSPRRRPTPRTTSYRECWTRSRPSRRTRL